MSDKSKPNLTSIVAVIAFSVLLVCLVMGIYKGHRSISGDDPARAGVQQPAATDKYKPITDRSLSPSPPPPPIGANGKADLSKSVTALPVSPGAVKPVLGTTQGKIGAGPVLNPQPSAKSTAPGPPPGTNPGHPQ